MRIIAELTVIAWLFWAVSAIANVERVRPEAISALDIGYVHGDHCMDSRAF